MCKGEPVHSEASSSAQWQAELVADLERHGIWMPPPDHGHSPASPAEWQMVATEVIRLHQFGRGRSQRPGVADGARIGARIRRGSVELNGLGADETDRVEEALSRLAYGQATVVNGNMASSNIRIDGARIGWVDWTDARVDAPEFDLGPLGVLRGQRARVANAAVAARAVAVGSAADRSVALRLLLEQPIHSWPDPNLEDADVQLRVRTSHDVAAQLAGEDDEMVRWLTGGVATETGVLHHIEATARLWELGGLRLVWGIDVDGLVGTMAINLADIDLAIGEANLSYGLFPTARGRGIVSVALTLAIDYLRELGEVDTAVLKIDPENTRSIAVAQRCGFELDGAITTNTDTFGRWRLDLN